MKTLISFGGQQQGISGLPHCPEYSAVCNTVRHMLNYGAYTRVVQDHVIQAQYWHDPMAELKYRETSIFLADINNEKMINQTYKENLQKLKRLVLVKFKKDSIVVPRETEWFGFYKENDTSSLIAMEETKLFVEDRIGLKKLKDSGRLHMISVDGDHLQMKEDEFVTKIINKYLR
ncbi:hypothetical protein AB6A40_007178 [Gnathostoma spinigerum]|uniref:Palmitoyl-protein thioesterase 1 n=1 Tax=Gnathostoma spinigerum TaxID=75299 RepID=A0ABD6EQL7_9BILA